MPSPLMQQLTADHRNFAVFLEILESQADRLEAGERTDLEICEVILSYLQRYGDQCHHPREDLLYTALREKDAVAAQRSAELGREHEAIHRATQEALAVVRRGADGEAVDALSVAKLLLSFSSRYRLHFEAENAHLFPVAVDVLSPTDWARIEKMASIMTGAERALHIQDRFVALRDYIHRIDRLNP
ncbi:MAG: hemerythrin domain-containing protein [Sandaracinaceae bacterium]|nr:hemerythrin domain-containing protein [Sandaracinaceae bacterium]